MERVIANHKGTVSLIVHLTNLCDCDWTRNCASQFHGIISVFFQTFFEVFQSYFEDFSQFQN